jgi:TPR repeat protein
VNGSTTSTTMKSPTLRTLFATAALLLSVATAVAADNDLLKDTPFEEILAKARGGDGQTQLWLGKAYSAQIISSKVPLDLKESFRWFLAAATNGIAEAQCRIGRSYYSEAASTFSRKPEDQAKRKQSANAALQWLLKAAFQGESNAYHELGKGFRDGSVFTKDEVEAYKWFHLAVEGKHQFAEYDRNALSTKLTPAKIEEAKERAVRFNKARAAARTN